MTDLEITNLCAEAMGIYPDAKWFYVVGGITMKYQPFYDGAQAMALLEKYPFECLDAMWASIKNCNMLAPLDLNRAICVCVAQMQLAKVPA